MEPTHLFELVIAMFVAIIALNYAAHRLGLPPSVALLAGGAVAGLSAWPADHRDRSRAGAGHLPAAAPDGRRLVHPGGAPAQPHDRHRLARRRRGAVHLRRRGRGDPPAVPLAALGGLRGARRNRLAARRDFRPRRAATRARCRGACRSCSRARACSTMRAAWCCSASRRPPALPARSARGMRWVASSCWRSAVRVVGIAVGTAWVLLVRRLGDEYLMIAATALVCVVVLHARRAAPRFGSHRNRDRRPDRGLAPAHGSLGGDAHARHRRSGR